MALPLKASAVTRNPASKGATLAALCALVLGCGDSEVEAPFVESASISADTVLLSHSLQDIAKGQVYARELQPNLELSHPDTGFSHIADVASIGDGFAILDRRERQVNVYDAEGELLHRFGREGDGPGEYRHPVSMAGNDSLLVVWNNGSSTRFIVVTAAGHVRATLSASVAGDWTLASMRQPKLSNDDFQAGPEDVTRRLDWWDDTTIAMFLQSYDPAVPAMQPETAAVLGFSITTENVDTLLLLPPHTMEPDRTTPLDIRMEGLMPMFGGRTLWTRGRNWIAYAHGDSSKVTIAGIRPMSPTTVIRWPAAAEHVTEADHLAFAMHNLEAALQEDADFSRDWQRLPRSAKRAQIRTYVRLHEHQFAQMKAEVQALWGAGECLFMAATISEDYVDGTSHTLLAWDVRNDTVAHVISVPLAGARIRHIDTRNVYVSSRNDDGVWRLTRYGHELETVCS